jgi:hypothetical protein
MAFSTTEKEFILNKTLLPVIIIFPILLFWIGCDELTELQDPDLFNPEIHGELTIDTLYAIADTTQSIPKPSTIGSNRLMLGSFSEFSCRPIIKFELLPQNAVFDTAWIKFFSANTTAEMPQEFFATAYLIENDWDSDKDQVWANYRENIDTTKIIGTLTATTSKNDTILVPFTEEGIKILNSWASEDSSQFNYGFLLDYNNANFIKEFFSNRLPDGPQLVYRFSIPGDTNFVDVLDSVGATTDAYLIEETFTDGVDISGSNYVVSMSSLVTLLEFDTEPLFKDFPEGVVISSVNLQLPFDISRSLLSGDFGAFLHILRLESELEDSVVVIDSTLFGDPLVSIDINQFSQDSSFIEIRAGTERRDFGQVFFQDQINNVQPRKKLYVGFKNNIDFLSYFAFTKRKTANNLNRPKLILEYWIPPNSRF